ncbi:hypothetical protein EPUS_05162 [Endocarpon pusillum Z07020]|uniref:Uncharacterized protein n=1 Tax=Endocarpon pusillum (strain Z07020 / HMAS-L-300199) TaxID=1263415 RepID=U1HZG4_ENDPU|nr:uncharacterized protein EPUS_05162 [Endocarpon pusillum Z07020]ERF74954.1 hypothetical protein EPUS_05162 [Endocarpon pusillum Z07020]
MPPRPLPMCKIPFALARISPGMTIKERCYSPFTPLSPFSVCTQQQINRPSRPTVRLSSKRKPARLRRTEDKRQASIGEFGDDDDDDAGVKVYLKNLDLRMDKTWGYNPLDTLELEQTGYDATARQWLCVDVLNALEEQWDTREIVGYLGDTDREGCGYPLPVPADVLAFIGQYLLKKVPRWDNLGVTLLEIAVAMKHEGAIMFLGERDFSRGIGPSHASEWVLAGIADLAAHGKDPRAMTLCARNLRLMKQSHESLALAVELCRMTEPGRPRAEGEKGAALPLPWRTWLEALKDSNRSMEYMHRALQYGALVWDDPEACALHAQTPLVPLGSEYWLRYATKGAMGGELQSMRDIGVYHLGIHGWFPDGGEASNAHDSRIGFAWLEMFAHFAKPDRAAKVWAGMAMVLREHGDRLGGLKYLQEGLKQIDQRVDIEDVEKKRGFRELVPLIQHWDVQDLVNLQEQKITSEAFLGGPIVPLSSPLGDG